MSNTAKVPAHIAADHAFNAAADRLTKGRQLYQQANAAHAAAITAKNQLLAASTAGDGVTAEQIHTVEEDARNTESCLAFAKVALAGAEQAHATAREDLRSHETIWLNARHAELMERRSQLAHGADDLLDQVKAKLADIDAFNEEFEKLRIEANSSPCAPHAKHPAAAYNFLSIPARGSKMRIAIYDLANGAERRHGSLAWALGHAGSRKPAA
ncbi:hypothetical protein [Acidocella sp.]|jgi:hypothetical protein|uniref:hypothetical protein n=1 Tax=Acidocella sp. TaxID=50710 RepID=UPI002F418010